MRRRTLSGAAGVLAAGLALAAGVTAVAPAPASAAPLTKVLVFSKTAGFRHSSIPNGIAAIQQLGAANGFTVTATEDAAQFTAANLAQYQAVIWLSTTGDVLDASQQTAFESYIAAGGGYVGVHAAADTEYDWPWYGALVGAYFDSHPATQQATIRVDDRSNVSTSHLAPTWTRTDEWYNYRTNPRANVKVLASLDESSYSGGSMAGDHPITWCQNYGGGRSWYTGLGHTEESYADSNFTRMLLGGIQVAAGAKPADCRPETGYTALFDGSQATFGQWRMAGPGGFTLANGTLTSFGGMGLLWYPVRTFSNYSLKVDWMMPGDDNGGVFIGFPDPQGDPWNPVNLGHEIQIDATDADPSRTTGSVYSFQTPNTTARAAALNPPGSWNTYEIGVHGQRVEVWLNGVKINDYTSTRNIATGYIGLQNDGDVADISYRNVRIKTDGGTPDPIPAADYQQVSLATGSAELGEAMSLAVLPNRSVIHTARDGTVRVTDVAGNTKVAGNIPVYTHDEEGLQGVAVDPNFASNRYVYLYYSPVLSTPGGDAPATGTAADFEPWKGHLRLSRFTLNADDTLNMGSERIVLQVDNDRGQCCHVGGDIDFDAAGNLYLTTGDDTNPFESDSYAPIDERTDRNPQFDAQRSSGNTNDLRGKVLRIKPQPDGSYTIPAGNLFPPGTAGTRPEIYAMGFRNPFRMSVDKATGIVYLGDYGPDAGVADPNRGPGGQVEFDRITAPGNYGWPYCTGTNTTAETYNEYTFPSGPSQAKYNCAGGPTNNSFRNTGQTTLPPAKPSWIKYGDAGSPPEFGGGSESPMGGPVYRYNAALNSSIKFPASMDGRYFAGEYGRRWIKAIAVNADGTPGEISAFPWSGTQVMDMAFGPDGALHVLDYGTGSNDQALYRIEYLGGGNRSPIAVASANPTSGPSPLTVTFSSAGSSDPEGGALSYLWTFGDGTTSTAANPTKTYSTNGTYRPTLRVTDPTGLSGTASLVITVGNTAPTVSLTVPTNGTLFNFGDTIPFQVTVTDPEDGTINCSRVSVTYALGHDSHAHQITSKTGCTGTITIPLDGEHDTAANIFGVFDAAYTDNGGLTSHSIKTLQPKHRQGEHFGAQSGGLQIAEHAAAEGGRTVGFIDSGEWISYQPYHLANATRFTARVSSGGPGGSIEVRAGSATGALLGSVAVAPTGSWDTFTEVSANLTNLPSAPTTLYLVFRGGAGNLFDVDAFSFTTGTTGGSATALRAVANNQFVSVLGTAQLIANKATVGGTEQFDLVDQGGGIVALRSRSNGMYVCAESGGANPLVANRAAVGSWERFALIRNSDGTISLRATVNNRYVVAENAGAAALIANRAAIGPWEKFTLVSG